ncbi:hypothetical protein GGR25_000904 [Kaistia hirudinis]|uniref:Sel1 repeat family protein n=1 Tax=Kaistia hirudinis TaxID=1293440 RepID=A0A840AMY9_9HYPH|nr:hypothetical protein [Kaistia hirudinis]MBB3929885.1 hypothetical protein [Kaistia hirudinis]
MARIDKTGADGRSSGEQFFQLGLNCVGGEAGEVNLVEAHKWFNLAAMRGYDEAAALRQEIAREMSRQAIAEAQRAARDFLATH